MAFSNGAKTHKNNPGYSIQGAGDRQLPDDLSNQVDFLFTNPTKTII